MYSHKKNMLLGSIALLINMPNIVHTMNIQPFKEGDFVKQSELPNEYLNAVRTIDLNYPINNQPNRSTTSNNHSAPSQTDNTQTTIPLIHGVPEKNYFDWFNENIQPTMSNTKTKREQLAYKNHITNDILTFKKKMLEGVNFNEVPPATNNNPLTINTRINKQELDFILYLHKQYPCFSFEKIYTLYFTV